MGTQEGQFLAEESDHIVLGGRETEGIGTSCRIWQFPEWSSVILERGVFVGWIGWTLSSHRVKE